MPWFPEIATPAFCETVQLRKMILDRQQLPRFSPRRVLEPASAEFIAALAAGSNSHHILQIGCGLSTIALAAAARATGTCLVSVHRDKEKQEIVRHHLKYLGLLDFVEFVVSDPSDAIPEREGVDFAFFTGDPEEYIKLFDLLKLKHGAIVVADNALHDASNEYIRHVRRQPGVDSSTLPLGRGIEVTKMVCWETFKSGRILYSGSDFNDAGDGGMINGSKKISSISSPLGVSTSSSLHLDQNHQTSASDEGVGLAHLEQLDAGCSKGTQRDESPTTSGPTEGLKMTETAAEHGEPIDSELESSSFIVVESHDKTSPYYLSDSDSNGISESSQAVELQHVSPDAGEESYIEDLSNEQTPQILEHQQEPEPLLSRAQKDQEDLETVQSSGLDIKGEAIFDFKVHFQNYSTQTEVTVMGFDQDMLLTDITMAFNDMGVSVRRAKISTQDKLVEDVFYVVDSKTRAPVHPCRWDAIKDQILQRIGERRGHAETIDG